MTINLPRAGFFVLLPSVGVGGALGVPVLMCLAGALSFRPSLLRQAVESRPAWLLFLGAFLALATLSSTWSAYDASIWQALKILAIAVCGWIFAISAAHDARLTRAAAVSVFTVLAFLLAIEAIGGLPLNRAAQPAVPADELGRNVSRAASLLLAITWVSAGTLAGRPGLPWRIIAAGALGAGGFISLQFGQFANTVAFAAGVMAFAAGWVAPRLTLAGVGLALAAWLLVAPFVSPMLAPALQAVALPFSWNERLEIWQYVSARIWEQPLWGHGLDAGRAHLPAIPVHPHSASLQIWFELGVAGALTAAAFIAAGARFLMRRLSDNRPAAAAAAGTLAALGVIANLSFNLWAEWWLATMFVAAGCVGALASTSK